MQLNELIEEPSGKTYRFIRLRSDGEPLEALLIHTDASGVIAELAIENGAEGDCSYSNDGRLLRCNYWETEEEAQRASSWSRHYTKRVGTRIGSHSDVQRIYQSLDSVIQDNYLRWIIRQFPGKQTAIQFESDFYRVATLPQANEDPPDLAGATNRQTSGQFALSWRRIRYRRFVMASIALGLILCLSALYSRWQKNHERDELLKSNKAQRLIEAEIFPVIRMFDRKISHSIDSRNRKHISEFAQPDRVRAVANLDAFLDEISHLERSEKLSIFHNSIIASDRFDIRFKAKALHEMHTWNLLSLISRTSSDPTDFVYDYLESQLFREKLVGYLLTIIGEYGATELAIEALLILDETISIQHRAARLLLVDIETLAICSAGAKVSTQAARAAAICAVKEKYKAILPQDSEELNRRFGQLRRSVLEFAERMNSRRYRYGDVQFALADLAIETTSTHIDYLEAISRIHRFRNTSNDMILYGPLFEFRRELDGLAGSVRKLQNQANLEKKLQQLQVEQNQLESQLNRGTLEMQQIKAALRQAWYTYSQETINKKIERAKKRGRQVDRAKPPPS